MQHRLEPLAQVQPGRQRLDVGRVRELRVRRQRPARRLGNDGGRPDVVAAGRAFDQRHQVQVGGGAVAGPRRLRQISHLQPPASGAQDERLIVQEEADHVGVPLRRPQRQAAVSGRRQVVAALLQLIARVGDQARLIQVVGAQHQPQLAAGPGLLREGDGDAVELAQRIEVGAPGEILDLTLIGGVLLGLRGQLGGRRAGAQLGHVDGGHDARRRREQRQPPLDRRCAIVAAVTAPTAGREQRRRGDHPYPGKSRVVHSAPDGLVSHAVQG